MSTVAAFYCLFIRLFGAIANKSQKESIFRFYDGLQVTNIPGNYACWRGLVTLAYRFYWYFLFVVAYVW